MGTRYRIPSTGTGIHSATTSTRIPHSTISSNPPAPDNIIEHVKKGTDGASVYKRYLKGPLLGKGGFAKCYRVTDMETKKDWACKIVQKSSLTKQRHKAKLQSEIKIHKALSHQHIVQFEDVFEDKENVYIVMELCPNQTMLELVKRKKRLSESETRRFMLQLLDAIRHMHYYKVIHRDLKLGNVFLGKGDEVKIGDFGLACKLQFDGERKKTLCGTPNYIAPEVLDGKDGHSFEVDTWSVGVVLYTCLVGKPPFETADVKSTYKLIKANTYSFPERLPVSDAAKRLVKRILQSRPELRPTIEDICLDEWFEGQGVAVLQKDQSSRQDEAMNGSNNSGGGSKGKLKEALFYSSSTTGIASSLSSVPQSTTTTTGSNNNQPARPPLLPLHNTDAAHPLSKRPKQESSAPHPSSPSSSSRPPSASTTSSHAHHNPFPPSSAGSTLSSGTYNNNTALDRNITTATSTASSSNFPPPPSSSSCFKPYTDAPQRASSGVSDPSSPTVKGVSKQLGQLDVKAKSSPPASSRLASLKARVGGATERGAATLSDAASSASTVSAPPSARGTGDQAALEDEEALKLMHSHLSKALETEAGAGIVASRLASLPLPAVWVSKWVDYSKKYGLGYRLSNGNYGVFFNDATKVLVDRRVDPDAFEYMERVRGEDGRKRDVRCPHSFKAAPKELAKKVTLTEHFQSYLDQGGGSASQRGGGGDDDDAACSDGGVVGGSGVYVRKWMRTRHSVIFRLSDNSVQVAFLDETELVLWESRRWVTYKSKGRGRATYDIKDAAGMPEIAKRLKYVKDILAQLVGPSQQA
eukprot:CAMPEP_0181344388 /NCGR_PEP_ID=MMETSP1101-20121128/32147_1 /TAXON_ID=46948 /ORGANISM="Rhodomonas abbreviata, Strain Caron Lab Isolate" /LENGTH=809 /DNA_ID=CAMNT_0023456189 /DNA_START=326 /DNA_END=2755 /DNA_ORIENTATION=-